jgi:hydrogenase-4 component E
MAVFRDVTLLITNLESLAGGLFIIAAFGIVAVRQMRACIRFFIFQSMCLAAAAFLLGVTPFSVNLMAVGAVNLITKAWILPWNLRRLVAEEVHTRREISQAVGIPTSLIIALILTIAAYFLSRPWVRTVPAASILRINVPIGLAGLLIGAYTLTTRREAVPQLLGILAMENGAFFAGVAIAPDLPLIAELATAFDILIITTVMGVLTRAVHERTGTTAVGKLASLREEPPE